MRIKLLFFASLREKLGVSQEVLELTQAGPTSVAHIRAHLVARGGEWPGALAPNRSLRMAVDQRLVGDDGVVADGSELAFFPPVTGG